MATKKKMKPAETLLRSIVAIVAADEKIDPREERLLEAARVRLGVSLNTMAGFIADALSGKRLINLPTDDEGRRKLLYILVEAAAADGTVCPEERQMLDVVATHVGYGAADLDRIIASALAKHPQTPEMD